MFNDVVCSYKLNQVKVGILQESPHLPFSTSVKRAMAITEKALVGLGYQVVPFFLTEEVWNQARDYMQAYLANGFSKTMFKEMV